MGYILEKLILNVLIEFFSFFINLYLIFIISMELAIILPMICMLGQYVSFHKINLNPFELISSNLLIMIF